MSKTKKKRSYVLNAVLLGLMALLAVLTVIGLISTAGKGLLPGHYLGIIIGVVVAILAVSVIAMMRKWSNIVMIVITAAASALALYGVLFASSVNRTVDIITAKEREVNVSEMKVAVLKDSPYNTLSDLANKAIAYNVNLSDDEILKVKTHIDEKAPNLVYREEAGFTALADSLRDDTVPAIVLNESYLDVLDETEGYETFADEIRYIDEFNIETDVVTENVKSEDVFLVYISGIDTHGAVVNTSRSDVNILAAVNTKTKKVQLLSTPRDYYVTMPVSGDVYDKLTHAGLYGIQNSIGTLENLYNEKVDYYLRMNFTGFETIIDAIGGIDVESDYDFTVTGGGYHFNKGMNHMSGIEALAFARERKAFASGDNQRGIDQMKVITATIQKLTSSRDVLLNYNTIFDKISDSIQTNMPQDVFYKIVNRQLSDSSGWDVQSYAVTGAGSSATTFSMPNTTTYVMLQDPSMVAEGKGKLDSVLAE